jgi:hypothetical protein
MSEASSLFFGLSVIKAVVYPETAEDYTMISHVVTGAYKDDIMLALKSSVNQKPELLLNGESVEQRVQMAYDRLIQTAKSLLIDLLFLYEKDVQQQQEQKVASVKAELATRNQVSEFGSVAEIAAKYNISKSEVRRLKAAGELQAFIEQSAQA